MDALMQLVLVSLFACALGEPLGEALHRRRGNGGLYANDYTHNYEPFMYAAYPLHAPVPILHVLSPTPLTKDLRYASSVRQPSYTEPNAYDYESDYSDWQPQASTYSRPLPPPPPTPEAPTILYARPNHNGGYTYHKRPLQHRGLPKRSPPKEESPVILRVHKVRVFKSR